MSQFYWQLQTNTQQQEKNDTKDSDEWSCVGLTNDNTNEGLQQQQQQQQQQQSYWWHQQNQDGTDPYSAAAFQGFRASSGDDNRTKSWQTSITSNNPSTCFTQQQLGQIAVEKKIASLEIAEQEDEQTRYSFGIHQPILHLEHNISDHNAENNEIIDEKYNSEQVKAEIVSVDDTKGNISTGTLPPEEKEQIVSEVESGAPMIAVAQVTPIIATSIATAIETPFPVSVLSCNQTFPAAIPSTANIARVGPISNHDSCGFSVNRVVPTLQPVIPNPQMPSLAPVTNSARSTPLSLVEGTGETQNTTVVERTQIVTNVPVTNLQQIDAAVVPVKEEKSVMSTVSNQLREMVDLAPNSTPIDGAQKTQRQHESRQILKDDKERSIAISTSAEQSTDSAAHEDSFGRSVEKHRNSKNIRDRYRIIRQQYPEVIKRLDRLKMETHRLDWSPTQKASLKEVDESSHRVSNRRQKNSATINLDSSVTTNLKNIELISDARPSSKTINHSFTFPDRLSSEDSSTKNDVRYGEDFVNSLRRNRHARAREYDNFSSRGTKSEMGEIGPYRGPAVAKHRYAMQHASTGYQPYEYYLSGRQSLGPHVGRRTAHELAMMFNDDNAIVRRPQSSFDTTAYSKYQHMNEFAQDSHQNNAGEHSFESEESTGSDSEIARIHNEQEMARRAASMHYNAPLPAPNEFYYFGVIQLPQERVEYIMRRLPPPPEYFQLPAIEKAAYLFYCLLYRHHYLPVDLFHKKFNREYFSYMCEGDSAEVALWKICKHTQEEYIAKRSVNQLKAYEMSQKQLFSDDHETLDSRQSERGSRCDVEDDSDQLSVDSAAKEPMKFRVPHSFLRFGVGGKAIVLNVRNSENILEIRDLKSLFSNHKLQRISNAIESFRGPLIAGFTPTHSVHLYVQRQIELILKSETYLSNPSNSLESDCLLIWQLLEMLVQQQGRVTGPDLSRLLMATCDVSEQRRHYKERSSLFTPANFNERSVDSEAYDRFTQFLLGGHIKEALDSAMKDGLYSDAMILARRMCVKESQELEKIETAFLSHRSELNPVMTLLAVANGQPAPVLTSPPMDEINSWRSHAAIVLANLKTPEALRMVYQLGCVLARRGLHAAADFCFLAVSLLIPGYSPFEPVPESEDTNADVRQHITLIHATLPGEEINFGFSKGFSIIDLHATEIFQYSTKLASTGIPSNFNTSTAYQLHRLDYAEMVSEFGNSAGDAFRYCVEIAKEIWNRHHEIDIEHLERLYELAERLKFMASADADSTAWLPALRSLIDEQQKMIEESKVVQDHATTVIDHNAEDVCTIKAPKLSPEPEMTNDFAENNDSQEDNEYSANTRALGCETVEWHIGQEALVTSSASVKQQQAENRKPENNEYRMEPEQLRERTGAYSKTNISVNSSQYSTLPPVLPVSTKDSVESSITTRTNTTVISSLLSQTDEQISHEAVQNCAIERKVLEMKQQSDSKGAGSEMAAEWTTDINSASTNNHDNTSYQNVDHLEGKILNGMTPIIATRNEIDEAMHSNHLLPVNSKLNQYANRISEPSFSSHQEPNVVKKNEKTYNKDKIVNDHPQNSGLFSKLKATIAKAIPSNNEMILPDDKHPSIVWDPKLNKYVGEGIEEESVVEPPPSVTSSSDKLSGAIRGNVGVGGLTAARLSGGSRYFNPLIETSSVKPVAHTAPFLPPVPAAANFGFIPSMPDDISTESPFSVHTDPLPKEAEVAE
ncbi:Protein transport protein [Dirofilaria immitis]